MTIVGFGNDYIKGLVELGEEVVDEALGLGGVAGAEEVGVVEQVIQVVEVAA